MRRLPAIPAAFVLAGVLAVGPAAAAPSCPAQDTGASITEARAATLCLLNAERHERGLPALRDQPALRLVGTRFAALMVRERFFSHRSPGGSTLDHRIRASSYPRPARPWSAAENLGVGSSPAAVVRAWMASAGHRRNILDRDARDLGVGVARGTPTGRGGLTFVTIFGSR